MPRVTVLSVLGWLGGVVQVVCGACLHMCVCVFYTPCTTSDQKSINQPINQITNSPAARNYEIERLYSSVELANKQIDTTTIDIYSPSSSRHTSKRINIGFERPTTIQIVLSSTRKASRPTIDLQQKHPISQINRNVA